LPEFCSFVPIQSLSEIATQKYELPNLGFVMGDHFVNLKPQDYVHKDDVDDVTRGATLGGGSFGHSLYDHAPMIDDQLRSHTFHGCFEGGHAGGSRLPGDFYGQPEDTVRGVSFTAFDFDHDGIGGKNWEFYDKEFATNDFFMEVGLKHSKQQINQSKKIGPTTQEWFDEDNLAPEFEVDPIFDDSDDDNVLRFPGIPASVAGNRVLEELRSRDNVDISKVRPLKFWLRAEACVGAGVCHFKAHVYNDYQYSETPCGVIQLQRRSGDASSFYTLRADLRQKLIGSKCDQASMSAVDVGSPLPLPPSSAQPCLQQTPELSSDFNGTRLVAPGARENALSPLLDAIHEQAFQGCDTAHAHSISALRVAVDGDRRLAVGLCRPDAVSSLLRIADRGIFNSSFGVVYQAAQLLNTVSTCTDEGQIFQSGLLVVAERLNNAWSQHCFGAALKVPLEQMLGRPVVSP
jgi:hypothetical protein